ncbi:MFS transporter [Microvirga vignae]|uniref:MFS transporter n=1 Tax=Microvirga vignae TaxID=1225564 RepID=A0A0H1R7W9_9HYPH|nr:cyclophilin-like fold protein [Microvirga vignae]KLK91278.1 MFS transporter [Microvirga vignae]
MKSDTFLTRRGLLGTALSGAALPRSTLAQAQSSRKPDTKSMRIEIAFSSHVFTAALYDNPSARDLVSMLPLELTIEDYSTNEKIAYLPRKLTEEESGPFRNEAAGDLCYYAPWGNLAFFYAGYSYSRGLIRLGRLDHSFEPLLTRGKFPLRIKRL